MSHTESSDKKTTATLTIDGAQVTVPVGATILEAAAELGIKIPTLCWLKKVSTTGACRVCVVKVEGVERFMTACNTPVKDGITVTTTSPELESARKKTLELMLVNHPLDCPICDAAGECDLQDTCYGLHVDKNKYGAELERMPIRYDWKLLESDPNRCILCEKCVKVCREVVGREAIEIVDRGDRTIIDTITGEPLDCDFCGNCINACPTGTLISKPFKFRGRPWTFEVTKSVCAFCSSGCEIEYHAGNGRVERVTSSDDGFNKGNLCINGRFGYAAFNSSGRVTNPMIKDASGYQQKATWEQALGVAAGKLKQIISAAGPDSVAGIGSPRVTNEENYLFQKFLRGAIGTNNIDSEARLGFFPAQVIQYEMLGYSGGTYPMNAIEKASAIIVVGSDLKGESAGFAYRVIQAATKNDAKLIFANSRVTSLNKFANAFLQCRPGSEAWLVAGLNKAIIAEGGMATTFIEKSTKGLDTLKTSLNALSFEQITAATGVSEATLRSAAGMAVNGGRTAVIYGADVIRSVDMASAVKGVVNLALLTGAVGEEGAGIYPLDEKNNTQGMLDMGVCPEYLPGYHTCGAKGDVFGAAWNCTIPGTVGKDLFEIVEGIEKGEIKALYVMGSDPLQFMPDRPRVLKALQKLELLIVQDLFLTETAKLATVVMPAATAAEKAGSFTSVDNRVQCFNRAVAPSGQARTDADILVKLYSMVAPVAAVSAQNTEALHHEITSLTGLYTETCDHDGCRMGRVKSRVAFSTRPAAFVAVEPADIAALDQGYPFSLTVGPVLHHNGSMTLWSDNNMSVSGQSFLGINPADAAKAGINDGTMAKVSSLCGSVSLPAQLSGNVQPGALFVPAHFRELQVGQLLKGSANMVAVKLEKA
ncbi:MAG: molybdopterin-dependent oxidoreductase [Desulfuromonadaceae bacterium]|nr:molybdopterin-dependent oxidoreductase [Desulfuromonadaceae bacterium]MDD5106146.1 molybdopterin-dependent oxidoreductase [Desulfuromonadaceae bacterium]